MNLPREPRRLGRAGAVRSGGGPEPGAVPRARATAVSDLRSFAPAGMRRLSCQRVPRSRGASHGAERVAARKRESDGILWFRSCLRKNLSLAARRPNLLEPVEARWLVAGSASPEVRESWTGVHSTSCHHAARRTDRQPLRSGRFRPGLLRRFTRGSHGTWFDVGKGRYRNDHGRTRHARRFGCRLNQEPREHVAAAGRPWWLRRRRRARYL